MDYERLSELTAAIAVQAEVAGALGARLKLGSDADPEVLAALDGVLAAAGVPDGLDDLDDRQRQAVLDRLTLALKQSIELFDSPNRPSGWTYTDSDFLSAQGRNSERIPGLIARIAPALPGLEAALAREGASVLDVGSGVGTFSIACCRQWPAASVVGIDPWEPAVELARQNVAAAGLRDRISLRTARVEELSDSEAFDLVWLPTLFLPTSAIEEGLPRVARSLRPGGWVIVAWGQAALSDGLRGALNTVWLMRRGASSLTEDEVLALFRRTGLAKVRIEMDGSSNVRFAVGQRPAQ